MSDTPYSIVYGQAWINGNTLMQDQIVLIPEQEPSHNTIVLIENIWDNLLSAEKSTDYGYYYKEGKNKTYFYWEVKMTQTAGDSASDTEKIMIDCPPPKDGLFDKFFPAEIQGDTTKYTIENSTEKEALSKSKYAEYWLKKIQEAGTNYEYEASLQKKNIRATGYEEIQFDDGKTSKRVGDLDLKINNNDDLINNLLSLF